MPSMEQPQRRSMPFWDLPAEIVDDILGFLQPVDVISFGKSCSYTLEFLRPGNKVLWRNVFLSVFEDPRGAWQRLTPTARNANSVVEEEWDWYQELRRRLDARRMVLSDRVSIGTKRENYENVLNTLHDINDTGLHNHKYFNLSCPPNSECRNSECRNHEFLKAIFTMPKADSFIHDFRYDSQSALPFLHHSDGPLTRSMSSSRRKVSESASKFHIFHGKTEGELTFPEAKGRARGLVYDWSHSEPSNEYGPFKLDSSGTVNWPLLEAVSSLMSDVSMRFKRVYAICPTEKPQITYPCKPTFDWAGVTMENNRWIGTYAFMDYGDLAFYNFARQGGARPSLESFEEATGLPSRLCLHIDESLASDKALQTNLPVCNDLPTLYFSGSSHSLGVTPMHALTIRGFASLLPGGKEVRWRFIIRYSGADQWQLEGVQPGGIRTGPIYGIWSSSAHEDSGPVGPFCYFMEGPDETDLL